MDHKPNDEYQPLDFVMTNVRNGKKKNTQHCKGVTELTVLPVQWAKRSQWHRFKIGILTNLSILRFLND